MSVQEALHCEHCDTYKDPGEFEDDNAGACALCFSLIWTRSRNECKGWAGTTPIEQFTEEENQRFNQDLLLHTCFECHSPVLAAYKQALRTPLVVCRCTECDFYGVAIVDDNKRIRAFYREFYHDNSGGFFADGEIPF